MECLKNNNYSDAISLLQKASQILTNLTPTYTVIKFKAVTLNNLGCLYKRSNNNIKALQYLTQALSYENRLPEEFINIAGTHLNLCAIKSHLNNHDEALDHALKAINIIQRSYNGQKEFTTTLIAAYHNAGIEYQHLNRKIEGNNFFRQGYELALRKLGKNHVLTKSLESFVDLKKKKFLDREIDRDYGAYNKRDFRLKDESIFKPESVIFNEESPVRHIHVDTTPWPRYSDKKSWPTKIEPLQFAEPLNKPQSKQSYRNLSLKNKKPVEITQPFTERKFEPLKKMINERSKPSNIHLHHNDNTPRPSNIHLQHESTLKPGLKPRNSTLPQSSKSLNTSPSKTNTSVKSIQSSKHQHSSSSINPLIASEKLNIISSKLENLQEKLTSFEKTYKDLKPLNEEEENESIISSVSVVNNKRNQAAILIQKNFRMWVQKKKYKKIIHAAAFIQKISRQKSLKRKNRRDTYHKEDFGQQFSIDKSLDPIIVQTSEKSNQTDVDRNRTRDVFIAPGNFFQPTKKRRTLLQNIILIQAHIKGFLARKYCKKRLQALVKIQKAFRKNKIRSIYVQILSAIIFIQSVYRGHRARKYVKTILPKGIIAVMQSKKRW